MSKRYSIIYADPPWDYGERPLWLRGGARDNYATLIPPAETACPSHSPLPGQLSLFDEPAP
jgi:hypothetical protein